MRIGMGVQLIDIKIDNILRKWQYEHEYCVHVDTRLLIIKKNRGKSIDYIGVLIRRLYKDCRESAV